jgi:putative oxygen-independent coproporphyrinogen III oxidase
MSDPAVIRPPQPIFGVYVHWPFCAAKCPYCDFNSHVRHQRPDQRHYARALISELRHAAAKTPGRVVDSIFFGGGTPSLMEPATVASIIEAVADCWPMAEGAEITLEANPSSVEAGRFRGYRSAGVNRLSLGVQALNDADLRFLGRLHNVEQAITAIDLAREIFPRLSFDLIYARPDQTPGQWSDELRQALKMACDHLSLYQLTIEEGTPFFALHRSGKLKVPDGDHAADLYAVTREVTASAGLPAYEISNHAAPGAECRHNLVYWNYGEYVGVGPGAHGRLILDDGRHATATERHPESWLAQVDKQGHGWTTDDLLTMEEEGDELLLMGLRLMHGIDIDRYQKISGRDLDPACLAELTGQGLVAITPDRRLRATHAGSFVLDAVVADLAA